MSEGEESKPFWGTTSLYILYPYKVNLFQLFNVDGEMRKLLYKR